MRLHKFLVIYGVVITVRFAMIYTHGYLHPDEFFQAQEVFAVRDRTLGNALADMLLILTQTLQMYNYHGSSTVIALVALSSCPKWQRVVSARKHFMVDSISQECPYGLP